MDLSKINYIAVLIAATSSFVIGGLWYSLLFAKKWQKLSGVTNEQLKRGTIKIFIGAFALSLIMALNLAAFIGDGGLAFGTFAGLAVGLGWVATAFGINYLFERKPLQLFFINASYSVVAFTLMGLIIGAMQK
jgi:hypothetical protein